MEKGEISFGHTFFYPEEEGWKKVGEGSSNLSSSLTVLFYSPSPEGPVRKGYVEVILGSAVAEEGRGWPPAAGNAISAVVVGSEDGGAVHAVEHKVNVRDHTGVPPEELQEAPKREHGATLDAGVVEVHIEASSNDHHPHGGVLLGHSQIGG